MENQDNQDNELMAELQDIIAKENERISKPTDAMSEGVAILNNLIAEADKDMPLVETQLFAIQVINKEQAQEAIDSGRGKLVDNGFGSDTPDVEVISAGKVELIADTVPVKSIRRYLADLESALVLSQWKEPAGILVRAKRKGETIQVMALGNVLIYKKVMASGDTITKTWDSHKENQEPDRSQFDNKWDYEFVRNTYLHLTLPLMLKAQSPIMYEHILDMLKRNIARQIMNGERKNDITGDFGADSDDDD